MRDDNSLAHETEMEFAAKHLERMKRLGLQPRDRVLVAIPMSEHGWFELMEACIFTGADFILADPSANASSLAKTIIQEKATVIATTPEMWTQILQQLHSGTTTSARIDTAADDGPKEPDLQYNLNTAAYSKSMIDEDYAAYRLSPAVKNCAQ
jgi:hypothetical protein